MGLLWDDDIRNRDGDIYTYYIHFLSFRVFIKKIMKYFEVGFILNKVGD